MKKLLFYALFISSSIILLSPLNAFADSYPFWKVPYDSTSYNHYVEHYGHYGSYTSGLDIRTNYSSSIYFQDITFPSQTYDYVEIPILIWIDATNDILSSTFMTVPNADTLYYKFSALIISPTITYSNGAYENTGICTIENYTYNGQIMNGVLRCNVNRVSDGIKKISVKHQIDPALNVSPTASYGFYIGSTGWFNLIYGDHSTGSITNAINSQTSSITQAQQGTTNAVNNNTNAINNMNDNINNSSTSDANNSGNSFFSGFHTESFGHLTDIVTAPLTLFSAMTSTTCNPVTLNVDFSDSTNGEVGSKNVVLPCGTTLFWENSSLGSKVSNFRTFWNILLGAPLIYGCLLLLIKAIDSALDPLNDELITLQVSSFDSQVARQRKRNDVVDESHQSLKVGEEMRYR